MAVLQARLGVMRLNATRLNFFSPLGKVEINGVNRTANIRKGSLSITLSRGSGNNRATLRVYGFTPTKGHIIKIGLGSISNLLFAGVITGITQVNEEKQSIVFYDLTCTSLLYFLNRRKVYKRYQNQDAADILRDLVQTFATGGWSTAHIAPSLGMVADIEFIGEQLDAAMSRVCKLVSANWDLRLSMTGSFDIYGFFTEPNLPQPRTIDGAEIVRMGGVSKEGLRSFSDLSQIRNLVTVVGAGSRVLVASPAGATSIPVDDAGQFSASGGDACVKSQRLTYTGKSDATRDNTGSIVAGVQSSPTPTAPTATVTNNDDGNVDVGSHTYKVAFVLEDADGTLGDSQPSAASGTATVNSFTTPGSAPSVSVSSSSDGKLEPGGHQYRVTFLNKNGETVAGPVSGTATVSTFGAPGSAPSSSVNSGESGRVLGTVSYKATFRNANGETLASSASGSVSPSAVSAPSAPSAAKAYSTSGSSFGTVTCSRSGSTATATLTGIGAALGTGTQVLITGASNPEYNGVHTVTVTGANTVSFPVFGTPGNGDVCTLTLVSAGVLNGTYTYKTTFMSALGETLGSSASSSVAIAPPTAPSTVTLTSGTGGSMTSSVFYYYKVAYVTPAGTGAAPNTTTVAMGGSDTKVTITNIPTSSDTRVIGRKVYRANSISTGPFYLIATFNDNSTTTFVDTAADGTITANERWFVQDLYGGAVELSSIATSGDGRVVARKVYRSNGGTYNLLTTISDNTTTSFFDNIPDNQLGAAEPAASTFGGNTVALTSIPTGPTGTTARKLYRTKSGGSTYYALAAIGDNSGTTYTDDKADDDLGDPVPAANTAEGGTVALSSIPTGPSGTTSRKIYRTAAGGSVYKFLASLRDNSTTTFTDNRSDSNLGESEPEKSTANGGTITLTSLPLGPAGTTKRKLYRTEANGSVYRYLGTIADNTTTVFTDSKSDEGLGDETRGVSTITHVPASTTLRVLDLAKFQAAGWVLVGSQVLSYSGRTGSSGEGELTGIPASGIGAIAAKVREGAEVLNAPFLSGVSGLTLALTPGDSVRMRVTRQDTTAQANLAAIEGGDGVHEHYVVDESLTSIAACNARGDAELTLFKDPDTRVTVLTHDTNALPARNLVVSLGAPTNLSGTFKIQTVTITNLDAGDVRPGRKAYVYPTFAVEAASTLYTLEELLRGLA